MKIIFQDAVLIERTYPSQKFMPFTNKLIECWSYTFPVTKEFLNVLNGFQVFVKKKAQKAEEKHTKFPRDHKYPSSLQCINIDLPLSAYKTRSIVYCISSLFGFQCVAMNPK